MMLDRRHSEVPMQPADEMLVCVQREWNGWQTAEVLLKDLHNIHWYQPDHAPRPMVHAHVSCSCITNGALPHNCDPAQGPHTLLVCVLKCHSAPSVYEEIARRANQHQS